MTDAELIQAIEKQMNLMISVATGGPRIDTVNAEYKTAYAEADRELRDRGIENPNPYSDLWEWYGRWSSGDLPSYASRRVSIAELFDPLVAQIKNRGPAQSLSEPTGWPKVDQTIGLIRKQLAAAKSEEQFQQIGLLCREALVSLAQAVHDPLRHPTIDGVRPSETDARRMLESYIAAEFPGSGNDEARKHARAAYDLAVKLQHQRTANFRVAALCAEATAGVVNVIAIVSGRRDPW